MPQIVVANSLKPDSVAVTNRAAEISRTMGADIRMLHVEPEFRRPMFAAAPRSPQQALVDETGLLRRRTGHHVSYKVTRGDVPGRILRESEDMEAVLTVIGHDPETSRRLRRPGGTAMRCVERARNAVLVVSTAAGDAPRRYRRVLVAHDRRMDEAALLPWTAYIAPEAALHGLSVSAGRKAGDHVAAMRRALGADLLIIGVPHDESLNPFRFRRLSPVLARTPECDTLFVPEGAVAAPPDPAAAMPIRLAS
jgi:nucleotide-binding universal stress UspA family protein